MGTGVYFFLNELTCHLSVREFYLLFVSEARFLFVFLSYYLATIFFPACTIVVMTNC